MIVASMCTIPERKDDFMQVLRRILNEQTCPVHHLHVWLNGYATIPADLMQDIRIEYHLCPDNPGPWVRYKVADRLEDADLLVTLDDDLDYPADYVGRGVEQNMIGSNSVICFGGLRWDCIAQEYSYTSDRYSYALDGALKISATVALLMGGVSIFRAAMLRGIGSVVTRMFKTNDDLLVSLLLKQRGVPILCAPKPKSWIRELPSSQAEHALFRRDVTRRHRAFRHMVRRMGFDPTAGRLTEFLAKPKRILVAGNICPPLPGSEQLDEHLRALCREEASVHLIAPMPASQARRVQGYVDVPYHIHSVTMMEPGGRWDRVLPVRAWREWRVSRGNWNAWRSRLDRATKLLKPTQVLDWQAKSWKDG